MCIGVSVKPGKYLLSAYCVALSPYSKSEYQNSLRI